jgi:hypothetical protein
MGVFVWGVSVGGCMLYISGCVHVIGLGWVGGQFLMPQAGQAADNESPAQELLRNDCQEQLIEFSTASWQETIAAPDQACRMNYSVPRGLQPCSPACGSSFLQPA